MRRRDFLRHCSDAGLALLAPSPARARPAARYDQLLILVELKGGNDGLNTLVPFADPTYYRLRPRIGLKRETVLQLDERCALHPALEPLLALWQARELAIVQGVGYPKPNLSHFRSIEIWDTAARSDQYLDNGWLARAFAVAPVPSSFAADGVAVGSNDFGPLAGGNARSIVLADPAQFARQARLAQSAQSARAPANAALAHIRKVEADVLHAANGIASRVELRTAFPPGPFGNATRAAAQIAAAPAGVAALRLTLGSFDTHQNQPGTHAALFKQLAEGLVALRAALLEHGRWESTLILTYSEFGRRARENASGGTDHGTAGVHFVLGGRVAGGLYGATPSLDHLDNGNLVHSVDFRSVYASVLEHWWGIPAAGILAGRFAPLELLRS
ncbi:MAG: DUF1501 domain-containing protein [Candidatus Accumulibacter sp.]|uniref:DUF1501 domain-containing protein n=1 Tax=Accumulibacter sp. TaxID=2053492 RepID=UPI001A3C1A32|nr:DUF1501 domain-containing protein [Accumulibacter sp.]MBL8393460.1 DUF1501 domain-containing protein [Accumulibacter sp.]